MNPTATLTADQWHILFHQAMAAVLRAQEAIKRQLGFWGILNGLWRCARELKSIRVGIKAIEEVPDGILTDELVQTRIVEVRKMAKSIDELIEVCKRHGFTNRSLTSVPLASIILSGQYISEHLDTLEMSIDPEVLRAIEDGHSQIERGESEVMERLF